MTVISVSGNQRRTTATICRARSATVLCLRAKCLLTSGVGAGTLITGSAHDRLVQGGVMIKVKTIHRTPLVETDRFLLDASGSR